MAKWRTKKTAPAGGASSEAVLENKEDKAPEKGVSDAPAEEVVISVPVHCVGCARKVRRSLQRLDGVEEVIVDYSTNTVVVRGRKALENPMMVVEITERRTGKKALLLSPPPPAKLPPSSVKSEETKKDATEDMKNDLAEMDMEMVVVLRIEMHCDACSEEVKRRILKIKGVEEAVPHMKSSQVVVKGVIEPATLVGFIHKCTGSKAAIIRAEPLHPPPPATTDVPLMEAETSADPEAKQHDPSSDNLKQKKEGVEKEKKQENRGGEEDNVDEKLPNEGDGAEEGETQVDKPNDTNSEVIEENHTKDHLFKLPVPPAVVAVEPESEKMAMNSLYQYYYHPAYAYAYPHYVYQQYPYPQPHPYAGNPAMYGTYPHYPQQTFSDQNPDACTIM